MARQVQVRVIPNASRDSCEGWQEGVLKIKLQAVPEGGRANKALLRFLGEFTGCHHREIRLLKGERSRTKLIELPSTAKLPLEER